jgi:hypothetical protein
MTKKCQNSEMETGIGICIVWESQCLIRIQTRNKNCYKTLDPKQKTQKTYHLINQDCERCVVKMQPISQSCGE